MGFGNVYAHRKVGHPDIRNLRTVGHGGDILLPVDKLEGACPIAGSAALGEHVGIGDLVIPLRDIPKVVVAGDGISGALRGCPLRNIAEVGGHVDKRPNALHQGNGDEGNAHGQVSGHGGYICIEVHEANRRGNRNAFRIGY